MVIRYFSILQHPLYQLNLACPTPSWSPSLLVMVPLHCPLSQVLCTDPVWRPGSWSPCPTLPCCRWGAGGPGWSQVPSQRSTLSDSLLVISRIRRNRLIVCWNFLFFSDYFLTDLIFGRAHHPVKLFHLSSSASAGQQSDTLSVRDSRKHWH